MKQLLDPVLKFIYQVITFTVASQYWDSNQQFPFAINPKFSTGKTRTAPLRSSARAKAEPGGVQKMIGS